MNIYDAVPLSDLHSSL